METSRTRLRLTLTVSVAILVALLTVTVVAVSALNSTNTDIASGVLSPTELDGDEASLDSERGYFCTSTGYLPRAIVTDNGRHPVIDISQRQTIDLRDFTDTNTWVVLSDGCMPIPAINVFLSNPSGSTDVWAPLWSEPTNGDIESTWLVKDLDIDVYIRPNPVTTFDRKTHAAVPTIAFRINSSDAQSQPESIIINTMSLSGSRTNVNSVTVYLPQGLK